MNEHSGERKQINIAEWSSPVARRAHNPKVVGSNPASATKSVTVVDTISATVIFCLYAFWACFMREMGDFSNIFGPAIYDRPTFGTSLSEKDRTR